MKHRHRSLTAVAAALAAVAATACSPRQRRCGRRRQRPCRARRARQVPRHHRRLQRLPHAVQDGPERPRAGHEPHAVGPPRGLVMPPAPALPDRAVADRRRGHQHRVGRPVGRELHRQPDARPGHRPRQVDARRLHGHDPHRPPHGPRPPDPAADADPDVQATSPTSDLEAIFAYLRDDSRRSRTACRSRCRHVGSSVESRAAGYAVATGILPIFACHSAGPVLCTDVPFGIDRHGHRHVLHVELVDRFHAEVGEADAPWRSLIAFDTR